MARTATLRCGRCAETCSGDARFCGACGGPPARTVRVGAGADADLRIEDPTVSRLHAEVWSGEAGTWWIQDLVSANGTFVNGSRVELQKFSSTDRVQLGKAALPRMPEQEAPGADATPQWVIGRDESCQATVPLNVVSSRHAALRVINGDAQITDLGSTNGTWVNGARATQWTSFGRSDRVQLGSFAVPPARLTEWLAEVSGAKRTDEQARSVRVDAPIIVGRDPACGIVLDHPTVSWRHARLETRDGEVWVVDLGSTNGTWVGDQRISAPSAVTAGAQLRIGDVPLAISTGSVRAPRRYQGEIRLDVDHVSRTLANGRTILDDISLTVFPGEMVALMGPSGAGKTTLLEILTGQRAPTTGTVRVNGADLHGQAESLTDRIGYVPQEDVMHRELTVREVLFHAARLRLPQDLPDVAIATQIDRLIEEMGLTGVRDTAIGGESARGISGGQRKRVNIALELITEPPLLFLDEPTSGLDATSTLEVMRVLRRLADRGKTIIMTIHQPRAEAFAMLDMLVLLAKGGRLAYFGPTAETLAYFQARSKVAATGNAADFALDALDAPSEDQRRTPNAWQEDFRRSPQHQTYVVTRRGDGAVAGQAALGGRGAPSAISQAWTLVRRNTIRKQRDKAALALQALQPLIVAALIAAIFHDTAWPDRVPTPSEVGPGPTALNLPMLAEQQATNAVHVALFLLTATAFWLGCSNVARELVAERAVFRRERRSGLSVLAYLTAHGVTQIGLGLAQVGVLVIIAWGALPLHAAPATAGAILALALIAGVSAGLLISSAARTEVTAISSLPLILLPQLMLAGYLQRYALLPESLQILSALLPVRWAFQAIAQLEYDAAEPLHSLTATIGFEGTVQQSVLVLACMSILLTIATFTRLRTTSAHPES